MKLIGLILITFLLISKESYCTALLKINGSSTVNPVVVDAAGKLKSKKLRIFVDTQGGSSGGISSVALGLSDIGMSSRPLNDSDFKKFPKANFKSHLIGYDGVALVVSKNLYDQGIKALSKAQIKAIYEGKIKNWKELGGPDRAIVFFNKEPGRGTWEVFAHYIYGDSKLAPKVFHPEVGANQEARTKVANHNGAITQLSASWAMNHEKVVALKLVEDGKPIEASLKNISLGVYPMRRPLLLITNGKPDKSEAGFINYLKSSEGQKLLQKHGYLTLKPQNGAS